jgi:predicted metal-binding membrane protein
MMNSLIRVDTQPGPERPLVIVCLAGLVAICWACLVFRALRIVAIDPAALSGAVAGTAPPPYPSYRASELVLLLGMWGAMLSAITLPAATPVILLFAHINRLAQAARFPNAGTFAFVFGYLAVWIGFGACATLAQWALHDAGVLDTSMAIVNLAACGLLLVAAGLYQWTPAKHACLQHCRAPLSFVLTGWRPGLWGALRMGCTHGLYCVGCWWLLLLLLFAAGVTNLASLLGLAALVMLEKLLPGGAVVACIGGLGLVAWGTLLLFP